MTDEQEAELALLRLSTELGKFAISMTAKLPADQQFALERLQLREWIKLIDVSPVVVDNQVRLVRVFMLTSPALKWLKKTAS